MIITREAREANDTVYGLQWEMIHLLRLYDSKLNSYHILTHKDLSMAASQLALLSP